MKNKYRSISNILNLMGYLLILFTIILTIPLLYSYLQSTQKIFYSFFYPFLISLSFGTILIKVFDKGKLSIAQGMIVCTLGWLFLSFIGALPYVFGIKASFINSYFEAMSGFTTTGITMFTGLDKFPKAILLWRSLTQWIGGLGIITFFLAISSKIQGAHRLFGAESHKADTDRPAPGLINTVKILWLIYSFFTILIIFLLYLNGMNLFDSINHSFTALSTGGFSTHDSSISYFMINNFKNYRLLEYIIILGMLLGGISFVTHYFFLKGRLKKVIKNIELRYFIGIILLFFGVILFEKVLRHDIYDGIRIFSKEFWLVTEDNIRNILFQVVSILTTTGFGTKDIGSQYFGAAAKQIFLLAMFIGGCVGSTGGGFKVMRVAILNKVVKLKIFKFIAPKNSLNTLYYEGKKIDREEINRINTILFLWIGLIFLGGIVTALFSNQGALSSVSGMFSALGNIGPCYMSVKEMINLNPLIKLVYIFGMLAGRLEILPVILLFKRKAWYF